MAQALPVEGYLNFITTTLFRVQIGTGDRTDEPPSLSDAENSFMELGVRLAQAAEILMRLEADLSSDIRNLDPHISLCRGGLALLGMASAPLDVVERFFNERVWPERAAAHQAAERPQGASDTVGAPMPAGHA